MLKLLATYALTLNLAGPGDGILSREALDTGLTGEDCAAALAAGPASWTIYETPMGQFYAFLSCEPESGRSAAGKATADLTGPESARRTDRRSAVTIDVAARNSL